MAKIPRLKAKALIAILEKNGFYRVSQSGAHLKMKNGAGRIVIVPVHSNCEIPVGTLLSILRQSGLTKEELEK